LRGGKNKRRGKGGAKRAQRLGRRASRAHDIKGRPLGKVPAKGTSCFGQRGTKTSAKGFQEGLQTGLVHGFGAKQEENQNQLIHPESSKQGRGQKAPRRRNRGPRTHNWKEGKKGLVKGHLKKKSAGSTHRGRVGWGKTNRKLLGSRLTGRRYSSKVGPGPCEGKGKSIKPTPTQPLGPPRWTKRGIRGHPTSTCLKYRPGRDRKSITNATIQSPRANQTPNKTTPGPSEKRATRRW